MGKKKSVGNKTKEKVIPKRKYHFFEIIFVIAIIIIIGVVAVKVSNNKGVNSDVLQSVTYSEYKEEIKKSNYTIVLLSRPSCGYCIEYKPFMNKVLNEFDLKAKILNVNSLNNDEIKELHDSISILKSQYNVEGEPVISTPTTILFANGKEIASVAGNIEDSGLRDFLVKNGVVDNENL